MSNEVLQAIITVVIFIINEFMKRYKHKIPVVKDMSAEDMKRLIAVLCVVLGGGASMVGGLDSVQSVETGVMALGLASLARRVGIATKVSD